MTTAPQYGYDPHQAGGQPPAGRRSKLPIILGVLGGLLVLCCGGTAIAAAVGAGKDKPRITSSHQAPVAPSATPSSPSSSPSPSDTPGTATTLPTSAPTTVAPAAPAGPATTAARPKSNPTTKKPAPPATTAAGPVHGVHPGAFCSPAGAYGLTVDGTLMQCKPSATDSRNRWRKA